MGKKFEAAKKQVPEHPLTIEDAIPLLQKVKFAKFDETVELTARLGVDPAEAGGEHREGVGRAQQEQGGHGHRKAG